MLNKTFQVFLFLLASLVFSACEKSDDASERNMNISQIKVLQESNVGSAITVVAGNGVYLLLYSDLDGQYFTKLLTNAGVEVWTKNISSDLGFIASDESLIIEEVLYDIDGTFAFFSGQRLIRINVQGEVVYDNPTFASGIPDAANQARILNVFLTSDGGYFVSGSFRQNTDTRSRAYFSKYSRTGVDEFSKLSFINASGHMGITDGIENEDGFTLGGYYSSGSSSIKTAFFIQKISAEGETLWRQVHEISLPDESSSPTESSHYKDILGRELIELGNGNMMYFMVPQRIDFSDQRTKSYVVDELGELVDSVFFDLASSNIFAGMRPSIGKGIVQTNNGGFEGLVNTGIISIDKEVDNFNTFPLNYELPSYGYSFLMDASGIIENMNYIDQSLFNNLSSIALLSNGNTVIFGVRQSIVYDEIQLITILSEAI